MYGHDSLALKLWAKVPGLKPRELGFAWSELPSAQLRALLGQVNFFDEIATQPLQNFGNKLGMIT